MNAVTFDDCCGACIPLDVGQTVQDVIDLHTLTCDERRRLQFLATYADDVRRDWANCYDLEAKSLNRIRGIDNYPLEISGDAIALYREKHS